MSIGYNDFNDTSPSTAELGNSIHKPIYFHDPTKNPDKHARFQIANLICILPVPCLPSQGGAQFIFYLNSSKMLDEMT